MGEGRGVESSASYQNFISEAGRGFRRLGQRHSDQKELVDAMISNMIQKFGREERRDLSHLLNVYITEALFLVSSLTRQPGKASSNFI